MSFDDRSPIYRQIADRIRNEVLNGTLKPEEQVMSTNQYAEFYRINPATAAKAFQELVEENVIYKRRGVGMFVEAGARTRLLAKSRRDFLAEMVDPMVARAKAIGFSLEDVVQHIRELDAAGNGGTQRSEEN